MYRDNILKELQSITGIENVRLNELMKKHTTFKIGGPADFLISPSNGQELLQVIKLCKESKIPFFILGNGSNLLVSDKGIRGAVIKTFDKLKGVIVENETIYAQTGILLSKVSNVALENGLKGLEFASGIPGTLGGAVYMNAGAYGGEMKNIVFETEYLDILEEKIKILDSSEHEFSYRYSIFQKNRGIILKTVLKLLKGDKNEIKAYMHELNSRRKDKQPLEMPSAGSVFKRPEGYFTGKLIEDCGLKGFKIGGAEISNKHCGFIVNSGNATCNDVLGLISYVKETIKSKFNVDLQTEIKIVGES